MATRILGQTFRLPELDWPLAGAALGLIVVGLLTVYSATSLPGVHEGLWLKQLMWALVAIGAAYLAAALPYRVYDSLAYPLYGVSLLFLVLVLVMGSSAFGAKRWLDLGPLKFQPSELAKIATVLVLARRMDDPKLDLRRMRDWLPPMLFTLVPFLLVAKEPDLGTSLSFPIILIAMYFWAGMPLPQLLLGLSPIFNVAMFVFTGSVWWFTIVLAAMLAWFRPRLATLIAVLLLNGAVGYALPHLWNNMHDYQRRRIETFLNPGQDPYGSGYQIIQSKIAIGSGGVTGKGYLKGTQKGLAFLPMRHTDFIYSVVGEELGLIGAMMVVVLYALLILRGYALARVARNGFASLMVVGLVTALFYHIMVNMLMTIGWAPVTGLPLPLLSYGGTALIVNGIQIGLIQNVALRRHEFCKEHAMYPDVVHWGFLHVRSYGLMLATAFLVGTWLGLREARRLGLDPDHLVTVVLVTLISSVLGARALYVIEHVGEFRSQWTSVLAVWQGGLTLYGGVIAGAVAGLVTARRLRMPMWTVADALAPSTALGTMFGRIGCFLNGCCYGRPTHMPWGVVYPPDSFPGLEFGETPLHPAQLYNALFGLALFALLWSMRKRVRVPGTLFWTFVIVFALGRIGLDFFRAYEPSAQMTALGGLTITESQLLSVAMALFGTLMLFRLRRAAAHTPELVAPPAPPAATAAPPVSDTP